MAGETTATLLPQSGNDLTPQEKRLIDCAAQGEWWRPEASGEEVPDLDPARSAGWDTNREIRADVIHCLVVGGIWPGESKPWQINTKGLRVSGAIVIGALSIEGATLDRTIWLHACRFDQRLNFTDTETRTVSLIGSYLAQGLDAARATIKGDLYLRDGFTAKAEVNLRRIRIEGQLACSRGVFENPGGRAISAGGVDVGSSVFLNDGFVARGEVHLVGGKIGGQLACDRGSFENVNGHALNAGATIIGADVFLGDGFRARGEVNLVRARIGGQLSCTHGRFENANGTALSASAISVGADVFFDSGFCAMGAVDLSRAEIGGLLRCARASFINPTGDAINLTYAKIGAGFFMQDLQPPPGTSCGLDGRLVLEQAQCRTYSDDRPSWPQAGKLVLDGFVYERFHDCETGWRARREWLRLQASDHLDGSFHPQPWTQAIDVLRDMGHDDDAKELAVRREIARAGSKSTGLLAKIWLWALFLFVGNGYHSWRAVWWSVAFILIGWAVFATAGADGYMAPSDGNVMVSPKWDVEPPAVPQLPRTYPPYNALVFALDAYLPVIEFGQDDMWEPSTKKSQLTLRSGADRGVLWLTSDWLPLGDGFFAGGWHRVLYWIEEVLGWVFVSLFIAGMSGIMKKE